MDFSYRGSSDFGMNDPIIIWGIEVWKYKIERMWKL